MILNILFFSKFAFSSQSLLLTSLCFGSSLTNSLPLNHGKPSPSVLDHGILSSNQLVKSVMPIHMSVFLIMSLALI